MNHEEYINRLDQCDDYCDIFEIVKEVVENSIGRRRAGLILGLSDLPTHIGAMYQVGSNFILVNRILLNEVKRTSDKELRNAYIFHILLHEYIHSLGLIDEKKTQSLTYSICREALGENHHSTLMARDGIGHYFSFAGLRGPNELTEIELVKDFERENLGYFA
ncbi:MAG: hypothetical protein ACOCSC_00050 [Candidatus Hadarchaeota archaeon]